jgi:hypothetical protein
MTGQRTGERAVSDTVAFTLIFAVIITSVGFTGLFGVDAIENVRDSAQANTAEVSMQGFAMGMEDIRTDNVPRRSIQLQLEGDRLTTYNSSLRIEVGYTNGSYSNHTIELGSFVRRSTRSTSIVYTSGAVFRQEENGQVTLRRPTLRCGSDTAHISLVAIDGNVSYATGSSVTLETTARRREAILPVTKTTPVATVRNITVNVTDARSATSWQRLFESEFPAWSGSSGRYTCSNIQDGFVHVTRVETRIIR